MYDDMKFDGSKGRLVPSDKTSPQQGEPTTPKKILADERAAATGGVAGRDDGSGGGGGGSRPMGKKERKAKLYREEQNAQPTASSSDADAAEGDGKKSGKKMTLRKKIVVGTTVAGLLFGGGGFTELAVVSGPLQIIHVGELLSQFHMDAKDAQSESRAIRAIRNIRYVNQKKTYKTHMGYLGNRMADKIETKLNKAGITSEYSQGGAFERYSIDPEKFNSSKELAIKDGSAESVRDYMNERYKVNATVENGKVIIQGRGIGYFAERRVLKAPMQEVGYRVGVTSINKQAMARRNLIGLHPFKKLDKRINDEAAKRYEEFRKKMRERIKKGVKAVGASVKANPDENGKTRPGASDAESQAKEFLDEANKAGTEADNGNKSALKEFASSTSGKLITGAGVLGLLCVINYIADHIDELNQAKVIIPETRMGMDALASSSQHESGQDFDEETSGFYANLLYDGRKGKESSWSDAQSIQGELHKPLSGKDLPSEAKIDQNGNAVSKFAGSSELFQDACAVAGSTLGAIAIGALSVATGAGLISTIVQTVGSTVLIGILAEKIANYASAQAIDPLAEGVDRGNYINYGTRLAARDVSLSNGGLPISEEEHDSQQVAIETDLNDTFKQKNLAYRLFNPKDSRSFFAQVIDQQIPDPRANVARAGKRLFDIKSTLSQIAALPINRPAYAALKYDYGFPDYAYTQAEMNDKKFENPFENAEKAADILDKNKKDHPDADPENYVFRAKTCFDVGLSQQAAPADLAKGAGKASTTPGAPQMVWAVDPPLPDPDKIPTQKTVVDEEDVNHCNDDSTDWKRIRFLIFDSNVVNSTACYESEGDDPVLTQACIDAGMEANPNPPGAGDVGSGSGVAANGVIDLANWKLTLPIGAPDEIKQPELATYSSEWFMDADGGKQFYVDSGKAGKTTKNSKNPRSELREMKDGGKSEASWSSSSGTHKMTIRQKVTQLDDGRRHVVVGQIHDAKDDVAVFRLEGNTLWITDGDNPHGHQLGTVEINQVFTVGFEVSGGVIKFFYSPTGEPSPPPVDGYTQKKNFSGGYFKAGAYYQGGHDGGKVKVVILGLQVSHE